MKGTIGSGVGRKVLWVQVPHSPQLENLIGLIMAKASTYLDGKVIEVNIVSKYADSTGITIVQHPDYGKFVRHISMLSPIDESARTIIGKNNG